MATFDFNAAPLKEFVENLGRGATAEAWLWQLGVAALAVVLGYLTARVVCREIQPSPRWKFGQGDFERVAYPLFVYVFAFIGRAILARHQQVTLLDIAIALLVAWIVIRIAVYVLGHVLPEGGFLRGSIRVIAWVAWIAVALHITGLLSETIDALDEIGLTLGKQRVTLWLVLQALAALVLTLALAAWISQIVESRVMSVQQIEMSTRLVINRAIKAAILLLAFLVVLPLVGIPLTALSIFSGALGVGLGFGLQKVASNYVSGFIVLLDRSLRIGDVITVDNRKGEVMAIHSRYTVIKGSDGIESIIPNEKLITESVNHHTYTDPKVSSVLQVTISYDSDAEEACRLLLAAAKNQQRVIADPPATARIKALADHGILLELTVWIADPALGESDLRSAILGEILATFRAAGIELPYPRRDVRLLATPETPEAAAQSST